MIEKYGAESAEVYFQKIVTMIPLLLLIGIASAVSTFVTNKLKSEGGGGSDGKKGKETAATKAAAAAAAVDGKPKKSKAKSKSKKYD